MTGKASRKQQDWYRTRVSLVSLGTFVLVVLVWSSRSVEGEDQEAIPDLVTWSSDIAPIIVGECLDCHGENPSAPFQLLSYEDAAERADQIARMTSLRRMPPWLPGDDHGTFEGERILTDRQIELFTKWWENGAPAGTGTLSQETLAPDDEAGWEPGVPDLTLTLPVYNLPAEGRDVEASRWVEHV